MNPFFDDYSKPCLPILGTLSYSALRSFWAIIFEVVFNDEVLRVGMPFHYSFIRSLHVAK